MKRKNLVLIFLCVVLIVAPFILNKNGEYEGADAKANDIIYEINPDYKPWAESLWEPPSGEVESFLFAAQAAIGAGFIGYFVGKKKEQIVKKNKSI